MEPTVQIQGQEPLTASMLAAAPLMDQKQLLGVTSLISAPFVNFKTEATCVFVFQSYPLSAVMRR